MTRLFDDAAVRAVFDWNLAIDALRDAYAGDMDERRYPARARARGGSGWMRTMTGIPSGGGLMGLKTICVSLEMGRGCMLIALFDPRAAELVALLDGRSVTGFRTAATSALAADL